MDKSFSLVNLLIAAAIVALPNSLFGATSPKPCNQSDHLKIVSLSIYPDPLTDAQHLERWDLRIRSESEEACETPIRIVEVERNIVAAQTNALIETGANAIKLAPAPDYQFTANERCFNVVLTATESKSATDDRQLFCAVRIDNRWWTMR